MKVELTLFELEMGAIVGSKRRADSISKKRKGHKRGSWDKDVEGALGELAVCKAIGTYWNGSVNTFKDLADVGDNIEVRHTELDSGKLIIRPGDNPESLYVLVTGSAPTYDVKGWIKGDDGMKQKFMMNPGGAGIAFFVPVKNLKQMKTLK